MVALAPTAPARLAVTVSSLAALSLFSCSAAYHRLDWTEAGRQRMRRIDHANIYLMIAGTYTPIAVLGLPDPVATGLLCAVWAGACVGVTFRMAHIQAPRALYTALYVVLGWSVAPFIGLLFATGGVAPAVLTTAGGCCYTLGAIVYAVKRPDPWPRSFGFHEVFHLFTIAAWICHYTAISLLLHR